MVHIKKRICITFVLSIFVGFNCYSMSSQDEKFKHVIAIKNNLIYFVHYLQMTQKWHPDSEAVGVINTVLTQPFSSICSINDYKKLIQELAYYLRYNQHLISDTEYDKFFKNIIDW